MLVDGNSWVSDFPLPLSSESFNMGAFFDGGTNGLNALDVVFTTYGLFIKVIPPPVALLPSSSVWFPSSSSSPFSFLAFASSSKSSVFLGIGLKNEQIDFEAAGDDVVDGELMTPRLLNDEGFTNGPERLEEGEENGDEEEGEGKYEEVEGCGEELTAGLFFKDDGVRNWFERYVVEDGEDAKEDNDEDDVMSEDDDEKVDNEEEEEEE